MELPERKRTRIKHFDYSRNRAYFITICTQDRKQILSNIIESNETKTPPLQANHQPLTTKKEPKFRLFLNIFLFLFQIILRARIDKLTVIKIATLEGAYNCFSSCEVSSKKHIMHIAKS